jgi:archaellin
MKLSPGSDPIDLTKIMIFVTTQYGETPYQFDNSTYSFSTRIYAWINSTVLQKGELLRLTIPGLNIRRGRCDRQSGAADGPDNEHGVHGAGQPGKPVHHVQLKN